MTSRELVKATLDFAAPARIPRQLWFLPWASERYPEELRKIQQTFPDDIVSAPAFYRTPPRTFGDRYATGVYVDEWGCRFENAEAGIIGIVQEPLLRDWQEVDQIRIPEELLSIDAAQVNAFCRSTDKFVLSGCCPRPFEQLQFIRTTENLLLDLARQPAELFVLLERMHRFYCQQMEVWANTAVDALTFMDDWGMQTSMLISPAMWRKLFKPLYRDYIEIAHAHGKYAFMHSDGYILDILPDLIEIGLDAINAQIFCMGVEKLGERFKGRITFWGEIDRQYLLPYGTTAEIINAVKRVKEALYEKGGVIAQCEFGPGAKPENVYLVFETWNKISSF
ncbi:MAG: methyltransferase [candidate division KSB1 bacterium]|nr:methyltransferase [candidate division KSB1 bacterium]MDZ7305111.1 methyltransferase [candidate division KSB1 bacterium]MDZ7314188.1 methyltransferase [candidate division KSB1 bacterium]